MLSINCPECGHGVKAPEGYLGKKGRCPKCGAVFRLQVEEPARKGVDLAPSPVISESPPAPIEASLDLPWPSSGDQAHASEDRPIDPAFSPHDESTQADEFDSDLNDALFGPEDSAGPSASAGSSTSDDMDLDLDDLFGDSPSPSPSSSDSHLFEDSVDESEPEEEDLMVSDDIPLTPVEDSLSIDDDAEGEAEVDEEIEIGQIEADPVASIDAKPQRDDDIDLDDLFGTNDPEPVATSTAEESQPMFVEDWKLSGADLPAPVEEKPIDPEEPLLMVEESRDSFSPPIESEHGLAAIVDEPSDESAEWEDLLLAEEPMNLEPSVAEDEDETIVVDDEDKDPVLVTEDDESESLLFEEEEEPVLAVDESPEPMLVEDDQESMIPPSEEEPLLMMEEPLIETQEQYSSLSLSADSVEAEEEVHEPLLEPILEPTLAPEEEPLLDVLEPSAKVEEPLLYEETSDLDLSDPMMDEEPLLQPETAIDEGEPLLVPEMDDEPILVADSMPAVVPTFTPRSSTTAPAIERIDAHVVRLSVRPGASEPEGMRVFVKVTTTSGQVGWGEAAPLVPIAMMNSAAWEIASFLRTAGVEAGRAIPLSGWNARRTGLLSHGSSLLHREAVTALDAAVHDAWARHLGISLVDLLGGAASPNSDEIIPVVSIDAPSDVDQLSNLVAAFPSRAIVLEQGRHSVDSLKLVVEALRSGCPGTRLVVDAGRKGNVISAFELASLAGKGVDAIWNPLAQWASEPVQRLDQSLAARLGWTPESLDELLNLLSNTAMATMGIHVGSFGGLRSGFTAASLVASTMRSVVGHLGRYSDLGIACSRAVFAAAGFEAPLVTRGMVAVESSYRRRDQDDSPLGVGLHVDESKLNVVG